MSKAKNSQCQVMMRRRMWSWRNIHALEVGRYICTILEISWILYSTVEAHGAALWPSTYFKGCTLEKCMTCAPEHVNKNAPSMLIITANLQTAQMVTDSSMGCLPWNAIQQRNEKARANQHHKWVIILSERSQTPMNIYSMVSLI